MLGDPSATKDHQYQRSATFEVGSIPTRVTIGLGADDMTQGYGMNENGTNSGLDVPAGEDFFTSLGKERIKAIVEKPDPEKVKMSSRELNKHIFDQSGIRKDSIINTPGRFL